MSANCNILRTVTLTARVNQKLLETSVGNVEALYLDETILIYSFCVRNMFDI